MRLLFHLVMSLALAAMALGGVLTSAAGQEGEEALTIYKALCPPGYTGSDYVEDCSDTPVAGVEYAVGTPNTGNIEFGTTDAEGFVSFSLAPFNLGPTPESRTITVGEILASISTVESYTVFCTTDGDAEAVDFEYETGEVAPGGTTYAIRFSFDPGDQIRCDWYNVPPAVEDPPLPTAPPTSVADPDARSAAIREGDCDSADPAAVVAELTDISEAVGEAVGQEDAILAATSFTVVDLSLQQLLDAEHTITVWETAAEIDDPVACGEIGGVINANDSLVIGLRELGGSGVTGIAFLSPDATDPNQTAISVFVAEGLSGDADEPDEEA